MDECAYLRKCTRRESDIGGPPWPCNLISFHFIDSRPTKAQVMPSGIDFLLRVYPECHPCSDEQSLTAIMYYSSGSPVGAKASLPLLKSPPPRPAYSVTPLSRATGNANEFWMSSAGTLLSPRMSLLIGLSRRLAQPPDANSCQTAHKHAELQQVSGNKFNLCI